MAISGVLGSLNGLVLGNAKDAWYARMGKGFAAGAIAGGAGYFVPAFAASGSGLMATIFQNETINYLATASISGGAGGALQSWFDGKDAGDIIGNAIFGATVGPVLSWAARDGALGLAVLKTPLDELLSMTTVETLADEAGPIVASVVSTLVGLAHSALGYTREW